MTSVKCEKNHPAIIFNIFLFSSSDFTFVVAIRVARLRAFVVGCLKIDRKGDFCDIYIEQVTMF